ncbi:pentatricopeptide repeat-containing protein At5g46100 [Vigna radiata var. radiata]|uniref:Pentatricopeptide repeat-containing protein At5g46100 n=1 Tax=Vigna radiata var. radiata TaxID=3916 RepID=A0A1S3VAM8_VIGRR|nr:pentatricopeptide repeat-containing protein At5g46100 [Vigna radiata var. radiata]XP_014515200.1 pentatricopeptide repeat-containing protein At5g46100 [Vigna radiata var. radiata]XP_014515201.1 pentatricopeptide repeat-containing protein At5g46100 [Vigna radiata var. radiata]XP_022641959.1 pentatricopeptide repeat-containing protein At5g46100 [Vigna radiata var. radiata]XP_022641960.1 pentatricopeptide repeat-containing protein At5g46100 [Vigna radiata var. radiata]
MGSKTLLKWPKQITNSLVVQLIKAEKDVHKAVAIFDSATAEYSNGFRHDHETFSLIISRLVAVNQFRTAEGMLERMKQEDCKVTEDILLTISRGFGRVHRPLDAVRVFHKMEDFQLRPTQKAYLTIVDILVEENHVKRAIRFYREMRELGFPPTVVSLNILIKALCKNKESVDSALLIFQEMSNHGCQPDSYTYGTLINGMCRLGNISEAKELFKEMKQKGFSASVVTYTSLIHGLCQSNNLDEAIELLEEMKRNDIEPNVFTYSSLIDGLCKGGHSSQAMGLLEVMVRKNHLPNMVTYSSLISGLCKEGKLCESVEILDRMRIQGLKPSAGLYGKVISGLCAAGSFQEAANFIDEMVLGGISPNRASWSLHVRMHNMVVQGLCNNVDPPRAFQLYLSLRTRGISVEVGTFDCLVKCFCKRGDLHKAARILDEMVLDGCIPDEQIWNVVIGGLWDRKKVREATELLLAELRQKFVEAES